MIDLARKFRALNAGEGDRKQEENKVRIAAMRVWKALERASEIVERWRNIPMPVAESGDDEEIPESQEDEDEL